MQIVVASVDRLASEMTRDFERLASQRTFACGVTGGGAGIIILGALRHARVDWRRVTLFLTDERAVPPAHASSSIGLAQRMLVAPLKGGGPRVHPMDVQQADLDGAAEAYADLLAGELDGGALDLVVLGVGEDGHIAGLFPRHPALGADEPVLAIHDAPRPPPRWLTLSLPFLARSAQIWLVVIGDRKRSLVQAALGRSGGHTPFEQLVRSGRDVTILTDQAVRT